MSFEKNLSEGKIAIKKVDISLLKFFWQANPFVSNDDNNVVKLLRRLEVFQNFSDLELLTITRNLHRRNFDKGEVIFSENDIGVGFYLISKGAVDIVIERESEASKLVVSLEKNDYFGELALLQDRHLRNASAVAKEPCELYGIFKPDLDNLIHEKPVVASKLLQSVSLIISNRLYSITSEVRRLKDKIKQLEETNDKDNQ